MRRSLLAGLLYFAAVFAFGVLFGIIRTLLIAPAIGEVRSVIAEVPLMLAISWLACGWVLRKVRVSSRIPERLLAGATALVLLLIAEASLSVVLSGSTLAEHIQSYAQPGALIGLAAQLIYASFPVLRRKRV